MFRATGKRRVSENYEVNIGLWSYMCRKGVKLSKFKDRNRDEDDRLLDV